VTNSRLKQKKRWLVDEYRNMNFNDYLFIKKDFFNVKSVLFNSVYAKNLDCMAEISKILKLNTTFYEEEHEKTTNAIKNKMWDKREKIFYPLYGKKLKKIKIKTCETFMPLFAGVLSKSDAEKLVKKHLLNEKEFWTKYPIPTIAANDKRFNPNKYWRGSTWVNINWFVVKGLKSYGFNKEAKQLKKKTVELVDKGFHEFFNPVTGRGVGTDDFAWSALVVDL
jgi:glycogen debranching enzyme